MCVCVCVCACACVCVCVCVCVCAYRRSLVTRPKLKPCVGSSKTQESLTTVQPLYYCTGYFTAALPLYFCLPQRCHFTTALTCTDYYATTLLHSCYFTTLMQRLETVSFGIPRKPFTTTPQLLYYILFYHYYCTQYFTCVGG